MYKVYLSNGKLISTIPSGTIDTSLSLRLPGRDTDYPEILTENFVHLMENFSAADAPLNPLTGQLWFDINTNTLKVFSGSAFSSVSGTTASDREPTNLQAGDMWTNTSTNQLFIFDGNTSILCGPNSRSNQNTSNEVVTLRDTSLNYHTAIRLATNNNVLGVFSKDQFEYIDNSLPGVIDHVVGYTPYIPQTFAVEFESANFLSDGDSLLPSTSFMRSDISTASSGTLLLPNSSIFEFNSGSVTSDGNIQVAGLTAVQLSSQYGYWSVTTDGLGINKQPQCLLDINGGLYVDGIISGTLSSKFGNELLVSQPLISGDSVTNIGLYVDRGEHTAFVRWNSGLQVWEISDGISTTTGIPDNLAQVATTGDYASLIDAPLTLDGSAWQPAASSIYYVGHIGIGTVSVPNITATVAGTVYSPVTGSDINSSTTVSNDVTSIEVTADTAISIVNTLQYREIEIEILNHNDYLVLWPGNIQWATALPTGGAYVASLVTIDGTSWYGKVVSKSTQYKA